MEMEFLKKESHTCGSFVEGVLSFFVKTVITVRQKLKDRGEFPFNFLKISCEFPLSRQRRKIIFEFQLKESTFLQKTKSLRGKILDENLHFLCIFASCIKI